MHAPVTRFTAVFPMPRLSGPLAGAGGPGLVTEHDDGGGAAGCPDVTFLGSNENRRQALTGRSATLPFAAGCLR